MSGGHLETPSSCVEMILLHENDVRLFACIYSVDRLGELTDHH